MTYVDPQGPEPPVSSFGTATAISLQRKRLEAIGNHRPAEVLSFEAKGISARAALATFQGFLFESNKWAVLARLDKGIFTMVASRNTKKIFCTVVRVPVNEERNQGLAQRFSTRPSRLLPWADPYIAALVRNLQDEVRNERCTDSSQRAELDPLPAIDPEGGWTDDARWTPWDNTGYDPYQ